MEPEEFYAGNMRLGRIGKTLHTLYFKEDGRRFSIYTFWRGQMGAVEVRLRYYWKLARKGRTISLFSFSPGVGRSAEYVKKANVSGRKLFMLMRRDAVRFLGGECVKCGEADIRVLQINHLDRNGTQDKGAGNIRLRFYKEILDGKRDDLDVRCANCNILYEYEQGAIIDWERT